MRHFHRNQARWPGLWKGCVGAWAPCLGPSGLVLRDWSGRQNHGTLTNMAAASAWGAKSLLFDNVDDYVNCGTSSILGGSAPFSVSCWFNTSLVSDYQVFVSKTVTGSDGWQIGIFSSKAYFQINTTFNTGGGTPVVSTWNHVVGTWDGTTIRCYLNGGAPNTVAVSTITPSSNALWIGGVQTSTTAPMNGMLDDIRVYNRVVNAREIALLGTRRGISYDLRRSSVGSALSTGIRRRRILMGME